MCIAVLIGVVAITVGFVVPPASAEERPSDPFGNHTIELNKDAPLIGIWESLRAQMKLEKGSFHECLESKLSLAQQCMRWSESSMRLAVITAKRS